jgi:phosphatidylglycerophosphate synthase
LPLHLESAIHHHSEHMSFAEVYPCDAVVLLDASMANLEICGLSIGERAKRVAMRVGAQRVLLVDHTDTAGLRSWLAAPETMSRALLVIDCTEQIVHMPLLEPLLVATGATLRIAVDSHSHKFAGALWCNPNEISTIAKAVMEDGASTSMARRLADLVQAALSSGSGVAIPIADSAISRHPVNTVAQRKAAVHFLFGLVRKAQDTWLIRTVNRRISYPFTRLLLPTGISPNMISIAVFVIGAIGCWVLARPTYWSAVTGTLFVLFAGYLDGCDGEIARIRLETSKLGAWIDTVADEVTTVLFLIASGMHVYRKLEQPWIGWSIVIGAIGALLSIYIIYYYLIVVAHSGNSQDYPSSQGGVASALRVLVQRNIINIAAVVFALLDRFATLYMLVALGGIVTAIILIPDHILLRWQRRRSAA